MPNEQELAEISKAVTQARLAVVELEVKLAIRKRVREAATQRSEPGTGRMVR